MGVDERGTELSEERCENAALVDRYVLPAKRTTMPTRPIFDSLKRNLTPFPATAGEGRGTVNVELLPSADDQKLYQDIQQEIARINPIDPFWQFSSVCGSEVEWRLASL